MAAIDLRNTTIFIKDGSEDTLTGTVDHTGGYPAGTKTIAVAITGAVAVGEYIQIAGALQWYTVIAVVGATTSLTLYPALQVAVADTDTIDVLGNAIYAKIGEGNLTYSEKRNLVYIRDRGIIDTVKLGDDQPMDVSMDFTWEFLRGTSTTPPTFEEVMKHIGQATAWESTSVDPCEPYCIDIYILNIPPCGTDAEIIVLPQFRWESMDHDLKGAKISVKGTCNVLLAQVTHETIS